MTPGAQAILVIAVLIAVTATAIIVVPMVMSWRRGRKVGRLVAQLDAIKGRDVAESSLSEAALESLMQEYTAERYARLSGEQQRQMMQVLGRGRARVRDQVHVSTATGGGKTEAVLKFADRFTENGDPQGREQAKQLDWRRLIEDIFAEAPADSDISQPTKQPSAPLDWSEIYDRLRIDTRDGAASRQLLERVYRLADRFRGSLPGDALDDVVSDTTVQAIQNLDLVHDWNAFRGLVRTIFRSKLDRSRREHQELVEASAQDLDLHEVEEPSQISDWQADSQRELLSRALAELSSTDRLIIELHYRHEQSHLEIAETLGRSVDTITGGLDRATQRLRTIIERLERERGS